MRYAKSARGFEVVTSPTYDTDRSRDANDRVVRQSSAIGDYEDARPGSSFLWLGEHHHLNREEVAELRDRLAAWLETGSLALPAERLG